MDKLLPLAVAPIVVWIGVFLYALMVDRRIARLESQENVSDDL